MKNILITGGAGFIGANLTRKLIGKNNVVLILKKDSNLWRIKDIYKEIKIYKVDLTDNVNVTKIIKRVNPDIIYHLAANGAYSFQDNPNEIFRTNLFGTLNLLNAAKNISLELFVNTGSSSEYGFKKEPMKESDVLEPNSFYAVAKSAQTHLCQYFSKAFKLPIVTLRPFSVYGPYENPGRLIPNMMKAFYLRQELKMVSQSVVRDFIYIDDFTDVCLKVDTLKKHPGEIFNVGSGKQTSFMELIKTFEKVSGLLTKVSWNDSVPKIWDSTNWVSDMSKTKSSLNFTPGYNLHMGLQKSWNWFKRYKEYYVTDYKAS